MASASALSFAEAKSQSHSTRPDDTISAAAVLRELNLARENPSLYASFIEELRPHFQGNILALPGRTMLRTKEGVAALDEAIHFLRSTRPESPLTLSRGMSHAANDHVADQASGVMGHGGTDSSSPGDRMNRYGNWSTLWGENISYGKATARDVVIALIVDDGLRARKHRHNIFNSTFNYAGVGCGTHALYRTVCTIDFAGGYAERGESSAAPMLAQN